MTKNKIYILAAIVFVLLVLTLLFYALFHKRASKNGVYPDSVVNVINNPIEKVSDNYLTLVNGNDFLISYGGDLQGGTFYITVNGEPVVDVSRRAEEVLLKTLKIDQTYACELTVILNVPSNLDSNLSDYNFGMSFCPGRLHIEDVPRQTNRNIPYTNVQVEGSENPPRSLR